VLRRLFGHKKRDVMRRWRNSEKMIQLDQTGNMRNACIIIFSKSKGMIFA